MERWSWDTQVGPVESHEFFREPVLAIPRGKWDHESRVGVMCSCCFEDGEGATSQGMPGTSRSWKRPENRPSPGASRRNQRCWQLASSPVIPTSDF